MFDMGFSELLLVGLVALLVLGPERLPKAARTVGYWGGRARAYMRQMTTELEREVQQSEIRETIQKTRDTLNAKVDLDAAMQPKPAPVAPAAAPAAEPQQGSDAEASTENASLSAWERAEMEVQGTGPKLGEDIAMDQVTPVPESTAPKAATAENTSTSTAKPAPDTATKSESSTPAKDAAPAPADEEPKAHG